MSSDDSSSSDEEISRLVVSAYNKARKKQTKPSDRKDIHDKGSPSLEASSTSLPKMKTSCQQSEKKCKQNQTPTSRQNLSSSDTEISEMVYKAYKQTDIGSGKSATDDNTAVFVIDTKASENTVRSPVSPFRTADSSESESSDSDSSQDVDSNANMKSKMKRLKQKQFPLSSELKASTKSSDVYINVNSYDKPKKKMPQIENLSVKQRDEKIMKKSVISSDYEKQSTLPKYEESVRQLKKQRRKQRQMSKGKSWFEMPLQEDEQRKNDLMILQMRNSLDPKRFYKGNDTKTLPKYYQFGKVIEGAADFHSARIPKKQRKANLAEELLADAEFRKFNKRKYSEIQEARRKGSGPYKFSERPKDKKKRKKKTTE